MNKNFKYLQKFFFLLVMGFSLCAVQACSDDEEDEAIIAVTGAVEEYGCTYVTISGYANLSLLPVGSGNPEIGIEISSEDYEKSYSDSETAASLSGNAFSVQFTGLYPNTKYKFRSFVKYGGLTHYGGYRTFTTKNIPQSGAIDLGLSVKWAAYNIGASKPEEYGSYYAWGETEEKSDYDWDTYKWCKGTFYTMIKYCRESLCGTVDNKFILDSEDDVAHVKWGGSWRMPTRYELKELFDNCTRNWITYNGVNGLLVTASNGNCIFLPAAGYRYGTGFGRRGSSGFYWSVTLCCEDNSNLACYLLFDDGFSDWSLFWFRYGGFPVRPVTE